LPGTAYAIPRADFLRLLDNRAFRSDFLAALMRRMRYLADRIAQLSGTDPAERLARFLAERYGRRDRLHVTLSKKDIAAAIGVTPETLSRLIQRLESAGDLTWRGRDMRARPALWARAGSPREG
jgi:CRP-like cAMP-binding protein